MGVELKMPPMKTARDMQIWLDHESLPGDTIRYQGTGRIDTVEDTQVGSSTYGKRVYVTLRGRKFTNKNPLLEPPVEMACKEGLIDDLPIMAGEPAMDPRTGRWYGAEPQGWVFRGGNQAHESTSWGDVQGQTGFFVNARPRNIPWQYTNLCRATLCSFEELGHDGYNGPGGTMACNFEWTRRMAQVLHYDGAYMLNGKVDNCHRAYAMENYGTATVYHGIQISHMKMGRPEGYIDSPVAAGNGYDFGLKFTYNEGIDDETLWAWSASWNFNGMIAHDVEIGWNKFPGIPQKVAYGQECAAVDLRNLVGGSVHDNNMPCKGAFASLHNCKYV